MAGSPLLYPFTLGMLAAVNPCGFPLLPAYLELFVGSGRAGDPVADRLRRAVVAAGCSASGFLLLFGALGLVTSSGWSALAGHSASASRYVMAAAGLAMVVLGTATLARRPLRLRLPELRPGRGGGPVGLAAFGLSYGIASIGCALPLFVSGVAASFGRAGILRGAEDLLAYGVGMAAVLGGLSLGIAVLGTGSGRVLRHLSRWVPAAGGAVLVLSGGYLAWYWIADIVEPGRSFALSRLVSRVQLDVAGPLDRHAAAAAAVLGAALLSAVLAGGLLSPAGRRGREAG